MFINLDKILTELDSISELSKHNQVMLQTVQGCTDPLYGTGSLLQDHNGTMEERVNLVREIEKEFIVPMFRGLVYTNAVLKDLGMYRSRVMIMKPKECYSYHVDPTPRIHIPLITNADCFFVIEDEVKRIPADGNHYYVDTTRKHTFVNASFEKRIHIVGCAGENHGIYV